MKLRFAERLSYGCIFLFSACWVWAVSGLPFFWDSVQLGSLHARFFYDHQLVWQALPGEIDSGHPPLLGYYLAWVWTWAGDSLWVSHWAMLPFVALLFAGIFTLGCHLSGLTTGWTLFLLCLADPVTAGQLTLIGPDLLLMGGFVWVLYGQLRGCKWVVAAAGMLLILSGMRGMMMGVALSIYAVFLHYHRSHSWRYTLNRVLPLAPAFLIALIFFWWHYDAVGWVGYHADSTWAPAFERVGLADGCRNILVLVWRWLDFGRWALLIFVGAWLWKFRLSLPYQWVVLLLIVLFCSSISALIYKNLSAHRYFMPAFFCLSLLTSHALVSLRGWRRYGIQMSLIFSLATGNLWVYPTGVAMGWDATLAYLPYHKLRYDALKFLEKSGVPFEEVGSYFPNLRAEDAYFLNRDGRAMVKISSDNRFRLVSNLFNDMQRKDWEHLERTWRRVWYERRCGVWMAVYSKK
jgi:hypothetical protein